MVMELLYKFERDWGKLGVGAVALLRCKKWSSPGMQSSGERAAGAASVCFMAVKEAENLISEKRGGMQHGHSEEEGRNYCDGFGTRVFFDCSSSLGAPCAHEHEQGTTSATLTRGGKAAAGSEGCPLPARRHQTTFETN
jgi:hypothetical protein